MPSKQAIKVNPERQRKRYTREFKLEAVRLLELGQKPATQLALELGVQRNQLYKWQAQLNAGIALHARPGRPRREEESELTRLRRELKAVTEERDILKEAALYSTGRRNTAVKGDATLYPQMTFCPPSPRRHGLGAQLQRRQRRSDGAR